MSTCVDSSPVQIVFGWVLSKPCRPSLVELVLLFKFVESPPMMLILENRKLNKSVSCDVALQHTANMEPDGESASAKENKTFERKLY